MSPSPEPIFVLLWRNVGPYHAARTRAAAEMFSLHGLRVVAVELCATEATREWSLPREDLPFAIHTLMEDTVLTPQTPSLAPALTRLLDTLHPTGVALAGYDRPEMRAALRWCTRNNGTAVLMSETKVDDRPRPWWRTLAVRHLCRFVDAAVVSGLASASYLHALGVEERAIFTPYGVVDNHFFGVHAAAAGEHNKTGDGVAWHPYFLACGRLIEQRKNFRTLLDAYAQYREESARPWGLVICGDGPDRRLLEAHVSKRTLEGVTFPGFQQLEALAGWYAHAGCFVHPATHEAWGLVVNEAMASGLPVLVSQACGAALDLVHEGRNGYVFDPGDVDELAGLMIDLAQLTAEERMVMGEASQAIIQDWSPARFGEALWQAFQSASHESSRSGV